MAQIRTLDIRGRGSGKTTRMLERLLEDQHTIMVVATQARVKHILDNLSEEDRTRVHGRIITLVQVQHMRSSVDYRILIDQLDDVLEWMVQWPVDYVTMNTPDVILEEEE